MPVSSIRSIFPPVSGLPGRPTMVVFLVALSFGILPGGASADPGTFPPGNAIQDSQESEGDSSGAISQSRALRLEGQWDEAEEVLRIALEEQGTAPIKRELAVLLRLRASGMDQSSDLTRHLARGVLIEASTLLAEVAADGLGDIDLTLEQAACQEQLGDPEAAAQFLQAALADRPSLEPPQESRLVEALVDLMLRTADSDRGRQLLEELENARPLEPRTLPAAAAQDRGAR